MRGRRRKQKVSKEISTSRVVKSRHATPRTADEYFSMPESFEDKWNRITQVISRMRKDHVSLPQAAREFGLSSRMVIRRGGSALRKRANGQYAAKASDRLLRVLLIPTHEGLREIAVPGSREASQDIVNHHGGRWILRRHIPVLQSVLPIEPRRDGYYTAVFRCASVFKYAVHIKQRELSI